MSRIGRKHIDIPAGVTLTLAPDNTVTVKGPKGELSRTMHPDMIIKVDGSVVTVERPSEDQKPLKSRVSVTEFRNRQTRWSSRLDIRILSL